MTHAPTVPDETETTTFESWTARTLHPTVLLGVVGVFAVFTALALVVFHSTEGVKALLFAAVGAVVAATPAVLSRVEYRLTPSGVEARSLAVRKHASFRQLFRWDELTHVVRKRDGFTFFRHLEEPRPLHRLWKLQVSDRYSGEVHVERADLERILEAVEAHGVPCRR